MNGVFIAHSALVAMAWITAGFLLSLDELQECGPVDQPHDLDGGAITP